MHYVCWLDTLGRAHGWCILAVLRTGGRGKISQLKIKATSATTGTLHTAAPCSAPSGISQVHAGGDPVGTTSLPGSTLPRMCNLMWAHVFRRLAYAVAVRQQRFWHDNLPNRHEDQLASIPGNPEQSLGVYKFRGALGRAPLEKRIQ